MEWTIGELVERASAALAPTAQLNGRVREVPDKRLIRWYATIGLLDPPSARRGRAALYGRRHLLQLIAVKRRQAEGRTIAEIQAELAGATDRVLEAIAGLPREARTRNGPREDAARPARPRFWAERAAPPPAESGPRAPAAGLTAADAGLPPPAPVPAVPVPVHGVRLATGVTLLLDGGARPPSPADLAEIAAAAEALLAVLRKHDLAPQEGNRS